MILKFKCPRCNLPFFIESKNFKEKDGIGCPNCALEYPNEKFKELKESMRLFESAKSADVVFEDHGTTCATFIVSVVCSDQKE